jgi:hypothetical protein
LSSNRLAWAKLVEVLDARFPASQARARLESARASSIQGKRCEPQNAPTSLICGHVQPICCIVN